MSVVHQNLSGVLSHGYIEGELIYGELFIFEESISSCCELKFICMFRENKNLTGTARYASCNTHLGIGKLDHVILLFLLQVHVQ